MAWKIERWLDEVFPGEAEIYTAYRSLPPRELAIVSASVLDVALSELLSLRLADHGKESEEFLGLNGDGRAPAGTFGARIQLALLVRVLTVEDAAILRAIKELRNLFAHRVRIDFLSPPALKVTTKLHGLWVRRLESLAAVTSVAFPEERLAEIALSLPSERAAGEGLLLAVLTTYQAYFHRLHGRIERLDDALLKSRDRSMPDAPPYTT